MQTEKQKPQEKNTSNNNIVYATGRRKNATARVWIMPGSGKITINKRDVKSYFATYAQISAIQKPFVTTSSENQFDVRCTIKGGGLSGQSGALMHGISRALNLYNPDNKKALSTAKLLTRDDRMVESKKYGRHKARRSPQFAKR